MVRKSSVCVALAVLMLAKPAFAQSDLGADDNIPASESAKNPPAVIFSSKMKSLNLRKAYNLQKAFVKNRVVKGVNIVGFKAGLTAKDSPQKFSLSEPISGVLLEAPVFGKDAVISKKNSHKMMIETELAYRIGANIRNEVTLADVMKYVVAVAPAIELPDVSFQAPDFNGLDIVANNAMAHKFVIGDWHTPKMDLDRIPVSLSCNNVEVTSGSGNIAMGSQAKALHWMINNLLKQGYMIQEGQILLTGNLGKMLPAENCMYDADFGDLGSISLKITG